jgi:peptidoglycan/xylan/chitin deacetylase (PgdA/CDA1 family)
VKHFTLSEAEEREHIAKAVKSLKQTVGEAPAGWYCRYGPSVNTRRLLLEHGGFTYDSDYYGDELPFWQTVQGKPHLIVPYSLTNNDGKYAVTMSHADQWFPWMKDAFDVLYREGAQHPKMMSIGMHMAHPRTSRALLPDFGACSTICRSSRVSGSRGASTSPGTWIATHPYPGKGLGE